MQNIIAMLPLKTTSDSTIHDYGNNLWRAQYLVASLIKYLSEPLDLYIVCPPDELAASQSAITANGNLTINWVNVETVLPGITASTSPGWYKQQAITLAFAAAQTTAVLKLDPDMLLVRPLSEADLWQNGKSGTTFQPKSLHQREWSGSSKVINLPVNYSPSKPGMMATPFTMQPIVAQRIIATLATTSINLLDLTTKTGWTDFGIYSLVADMMGGLAEYHFPTNLHGTEYGNAAMTKTVAINPATGFFAIIQGFANIPKIVVDGMVSPYI